MKNPLLLVSKHKGSITNISFYFLANLLGAVISLFLSPQLAKNLSPLDYSTIGYYQAFNTLLIPFFSLEFFRYYAKNYFILDKEKRQELLNTLISSQIILGFVHLILFTGGLYMYMRMRNIQIDFLPYSLVSFIGCYFGIFFTFRLVHLKMQRSAKEYFYSSITNKTLVVLFSILLVIIFKFGALGRLSALLIGSLSLCIYSLKTLMTKFVINFDTFKKAFKFSWPLIIASMLNFFFSGVDRLFLGEVNNASQFGLYNIAGGIITYVFMFSKAIHDNFEPDFFEAVTKKNDKKLFRVSSLVFAMNLIPIIIFIILAPFIIKVLTAGRYTEAYRYARIMVLSGVTSNMYYIVSSIIVAYGYTMMTLINKILGTLLSLATYAYLIKRFEFYGGAWGQVITYFLMFILSVTLFFILRWREK